MGHGTSHRYSGAVAISPMNAFRLEGEYWTVEYEGAVFRLRDAKGLH